MRKKVYIQPLGEEFQVVVQWRKGSERGRAVEVVATVDEIGEFVAATLKAAEES